MVDGHQLLPTELLWRSEGSYPPDGHLDQKASVHCIARLSEFVFDDCLIIAHSQRHRQWSMKESNGFDKLTGQRVGHKKTIAFSALPAKDDVFI